MSINRRGPTTTRALEPRANRVGIPIPLSSSLNHFAIQTQRKDMSNTSHGDALTDQPLAGIVIGENFHTWSDEVRQDFVDNAFNGAVGGRLLSESDRVRVWEIRLQ